MAVPVVAAGNRPLSNTFEARAGMRGLYSVIYSHQSYRADSARFLLVARGVVAVFGLAAEQPDQGFRIGLIEKENAVQMIYFVLDHARFQF